MLDSNKNINLNEAASQFLSALSYEDVAFGQQVVNQFVRWFGRERRMGSLTANEVANYAQRISSSDTDYQRKLDILKTFLAGENKNGWAGKNMSVYLKIKKAKAKPKAVPHSGKKKNVIEMTREGYQVLKNELESLKSQRPQIVEEIRRAAEDKDFRENAPLHAAKERMGYLEGRIMQLSEELKIAQVIDEKAPAVTKIRTGDCVLLIDPSSGKELRYTIVSPREVNPTKGKISNVSPIGKAVIGRECGDIVDIEVPVGKLCYRIERPEK